MIFTKKDQTLFLNSWNYNSILIINVLAKIIENAGGKIKKQTTGYIVNRSIIEKIDEIKNDINRVEMLENKNVIDSDRAAVLKRSYNNNIDVLNEYNNNPVEVKYSNYISFILDDTYYYLQIDDNPFFEFYFTKTPVIDNKYSRDAVLQELDKSSWLYDCFLSMNCKNADIIEGANIIYNELINAKNSTIRRDNKRVRVQNTYNGGYHYETVYSPERKQEIDF